uniref:taste receptor type 2 member 40-like n=1 Tax=Euleptes europaea TaxID=460621 RepID=UPI0025411453|nr:taste receptor type 2 member 40-like [Euleptes europaea]
MEASGCKVPTSDNSSLSSIIFLVFSALEALVGMGLNALIAVVSCTHGMKNRQLKCVDKILTALGVSRFCQLSIFIVKIIWMTISSTNFEMTRMYHLVKGTIWFLTSICFNFSACLCFFYCVKIANFRHRLFIHLKMEISRLVPWMLLVSVFASLANTFPFFHGLYSITCKNNTGYGTSGNQTLEDLTLETNLVYLFVFCGTGFSVAFSMSITLSGLLLFSLWRHTHLMQNGSTSFSDLSMAAHFKAVKTIMLLLIVDSVNFVGLMILLSNRFSERTPINQLVTIVVFVCPTVQSQIMIWGNPKLKKAFTRVIDCIRHMFLV